MRKHERLQKQYAAIWHVQCQDANGNSSENKTHVSNKAGGICGDAFQKRGGKKASWDLKGKASVILQ